MARRNALLREVLGNANRLVAPTRFVGDWYAGQGLAPDNLVEITPGLKLPSPILPGRRPSEGSVNLVGEAGKHVVVDEGTRLLAEREPRPDLSPRPDLPDDTRLWAALQHASGGPWGGCVYDVDAIAI